MVSCRLEGDVLRIREGFTRRTVLDLGALRLAFLVVRTSARWYVVASSTSMAFVDLDGGDDRERAAVETMLTAVLGQRRASGGSLALSDYAGGSALMPLEAVRRGAPDLVAALARTRPRRLAARQRWLAGSPRVDLRGSLGAVATLTPDGFRRGERFIAWTEVGAIHVETTNGLRTDLLILPRGRRGGMFDLKRFHHSLPFVPGRRKELYQAECTFWLGRADQARGPTIGRIARQAVRVGTT